MADKEERILIARSTDYTITDTDEGALFDGKIAPHCANVMTREQAIEKISHALCTKVHGACEICEAVAGGNENHCNDYRTYAEAALNALLEDKK